MCSKPSVPKPDTRLQEQSLQLQREQMEMAKDNQRAQMAMATRNALLASAPPPPRPNKTAQVAALPLDSMGRLAPRGIGRRRLRTSGASVSPLSIPAS